MSLSFTNPTVKDIKNIPNHINKLYIKDVLSIKCMKEINKLKWINELILFQIDIRVDVASEISKSKNIKILKLFNNYIDEDGINEILKSKTIIELYTSKSLLIGKSLLISKSIVLKNSYIYDVNDSTVLNLVLLLWKNSFYTTNTNHNKYNWDQKYEIL